MCKKYSSVFNIIGYIIALATLIITAHSAISSKKSLDLAILQYQESILPTWNWTINDSLNIITPSSTDSQIEIEDICAFFPTQIVGEDFELDMFPSDNSLHITRLKGMTERHLKKIFKNKTIDKTEIICSSLGIPTYMKITYIHKGQRKIVNEIFLLRCDFVYDIEQPIQIMFSKLYLERYLRYNEKGNKIIEDLYDDILKDYKAKIKL